MPTGDGLTQTLAMTIASLELNGAGNIALMLKLALATVL
jgi:hypothetical protein